MEVVKVHGGIVRHRQVDTGEQDEEDHHHDAQGFDGSEFRKLGERDPSDLPGEDGSDERDIETQP